MIDRPTIEFLSAPAHCHVFFRDSCSLLTPLNSFNAQDAKVATFALKLRVTATHVVQQVEEFLVAIQKALDKLGSGSEEGTNEEEK